MFTHTEYYTAIKREKLESFLEKYAHLETIMLSEIFQTHMFKYCIICLYEKLIVKQIKQENKR